MLLDVGLPGWVPWGLAGAALAWAFTRFFAGYPPSAGTRLLSRREAALVRAAADAFYPAGGAVEPSGSEAGVPEHADRYLQAVTPGTRILMRLLFALVEHATLVFAAPGPGGRRRFTALSPEQRVAVLEGWQTSDAFARRLVFTSLRAICTMGYFADPAVLRRLRLAPYAIDSPVVPLDTWVPRAGQGIETIRYRPDEVSVAGPHDRPPAGRPLDLEGPLHPDFAEPRR